MCERVVGSVSVCEGVCEWWGGVGVGVGVGVCVYVRGEWECESGNVGVREK